MTRFIFALLVVVFSTLPAYAKRVALVIGNSQYLHVTPLANPARDAALMQGALEAAGFEVTLLTDLDQRRMKQAMLEFGRQLKNGAEASMFYYAGHGIEVDGRNFLVPIDSNVENKEEADLQNIELNDFLALMKNSGVPLNIIVLDACRNNPFRSMRGENGGLASVLAPSGTYVAYATAAGAVASDGEGKNSPFTEALASTIRKPGLVLESVFKQTRTQVRNATKGQQVPFDSSAIEGDFYFIEASPKIAVGTEEEKKVALASPDIAPDYIAPDVSATKRTIKVATDGSGDFKTIAEAVAAAKAGDRIEILAGQYFGGVTIDKSLEIIGIDSPLWEANATHVIEWTAQSGLISNLRIMQTHRASQDDTRLSAVAFRNGSARLENSVLASNSDDVITVRGKSSDPIIIGNKIINGHFSGITISENTKARILDNFISSHQRSGVVVSGKATLVGNILEANEKDGLTLLEGSSVKANNNKFQNNGYGIALHAANADIRENEISSNREYGVYVDENSSGIFKRNTMKANKKRNWLIKANAKNILREGNIE